MLPVVILLLSTSASAGDLESWSRQIVNDPSFKVRVSAVLRLGQLADRQAVPVLTYALNDEEAAVRAMAASALSRVVDRKVELDVLAKALTALRSQASTDSDRRARAAATAAVATVEAIERIAKPRSTKNAVFVQVELMADATDTFDRQALARLTAIGQDAILAANDRALVEWPSGKRPSRKQLKKANARAIVVMASLASLEVHDRGRRAEIECKLSLILATYPERAARTFVDGKAKLEVGNTSASLERGKRRCARDIVTHLMGNRIATDLLTTAR